MQDYETIKNYELILKQKRIKFRRILISNYKCGQIQILVELFIDFKNRNAASQKIMQLIRDGLYFSKLVILILVQWPYPVHRLLRRIKNEKEEMRFHLSDVPLSGGSRLSRMLSLLNNIYKTKLMCTKYLCLVGQILLGLP